jgi:hypothetical protein
MNVKAKTLSEIRSGSQVYAQVSQVKPEQGEIFISGGVRLIPYLGLGQLG